MRLPLWIVAGILAFGWACGDGTGPPPSVATVSIQPGTGIEVVPNGTQLLTAVPKDAKGNALTDRTVTWTTSDPTKVTVAAGLVTGVAIGTANVTATADGIAATVEVKVKDGGIVSSAGSTFSAQGGAVNVAAPAGAVSQASSITVSPAGTTPASARLLPGTAFDFGPPALTFAQPVKITIKYDPANIPSGSPESEVQLYEVAGGAWRVIAGSTVDLAAKTVSGTVSHLGTFAAMNRAGLAANVAAFSGNNQTGTAGGNIPDPPKVKVTDAEGNFVAGYAVTFAPGSNSGSVTGGSVVTDASGLATVGSWRLGTTVGAQTLIATANGLNGSPVTFTANAVAPVPSAIAVAGGDNQSARPGNNVATSPSFRVTDPSGIPVPGVTVSFLVTEGGGSVSSPTAVTNTDGIVAVSWTLGSSLGPNTMQASIPGGIPTAIVHATSAAAPPTTIAINGGDGQSANAGSAVPIAPSVKVTDADGVGVSGVAVTFSIRSGGGSLTGANAVTNAQGIATVGSWTLGLGGNSIFASVPGLAGDPVIFVALGTAAVQIVTFGDSNTDLGFIGTNTSPKVGSYVSATNPAIKLGANAPNDATQLAGKIEAVWKANRSATVRAVNHGITGTSTGTGRSIVLAPNALEVVNGISRFAGEVLGDAYPWSGGEPTNDFYPTGAIQRVQAFKPRSSDFGYISMGTNDIGDGVSTTVIRNNLEIMIDQWISRGLAPNRLMITTIPPRRASENVGARIATLNGLIRTLANQKGIRLIDLSFFVSNGDGVSWKASSGDPAYPGPLHVDNDELHYSEVVRKWLADQVVSIMLQLNP